MKRREFIAILGGAIAAPLTAVAQQAERVRRIAVLMNVDGSDMRASYKELLESLQKLGWIDGRNVRIESRWAARGEAGEIRKHVADIIALAPDVIVSTGTAGLVPLLQATRTVPVVFTNITDPVGSGFVKTMARPGGNATGFVQMEYSLGAKWPELLRQVAPATKRIAVLRDAALTSGVGLFAVIAAVAPSMGMEVSVINESDAAEIERDITEFAQTANGALIVAPSALAVAHRDLVLGLAAKHKLPSMYYRRHFVDKGGLITYGPDIRQQFSGLAEYVDRVLKGARPADLPVQAPTKYELVINLKTAKSLGLNIPQGLLSAADEVIE
jgi:putative ABC transport system substrate-binding protein